MKRIVALTSAGVLLASGLTLATAASANAVTCYGGAASYTKKANKYIQPPDLRGYYVTTNRCSDINIKTNSAVDVKVCMRTGHMTYACPDRYTRTTAGQWKVIAYDMKDGFAFNLYFKNSAEHTGKLAF
ncbi:hypothetical protein [Streptomyces lanatus]|uniref:Secreted protein n=1 Tax=Streptomyces lanatus TaxID=66900 RepID=A0ABV1XIZ9_9ACTN|nr:hypothetical protein [Streptomyces lanatus]GHG91774.1 hypothetical protein GCM10018780_12650 [Streptomyces lanatus]